MANIEALRQLRRVVEAAPEKLLQMGEHWIRTSNGLAFDAAGWAILDWWFREKTIYGTVEITDGGRPRSSKLTPADHAKVFDISLVDAQRLLAFDPYFVTHEVPKSAVIANIDRLIAGLPAEPYA